VDFRLHLLLADWTTGVWLKVSDEAFYFNGWWLLSQKKKITKKSGSMRVSKACTLVVQNCSKRCSYKRPVISLLPAIIPICNHHLTITSKINKNLLSPKHKTVYQVRPLYITQQSTYIDFTNLSVVSSNFCTIGS